MEAFKKNDPAGYYRTKKANVNCEMLVSERIYVKRLGFLVEKVDPHEHISPLPAENSLDMHILTYFDTTLP